MGIHRVLKELGAYTLPDEDITMYEESQKRLPGIHRILMALGAYTLSDEDIAWYEESQRHPQITDENETSAGGAPMPGQSSKDDGAPKSPVEVKEGQVATFQAIASKEPGKEGRKRLEELRDQGA